MKRIGSHVGDSRTVLHVSEAFGGGVVAAVRAHVAASPEFRHLLAFSDRLEAIVSDATSTATEVWTEHEGEAVAAFQAWWAREDSPAKALDQWARGAAEFERMALER